ncbi:hypothetical protein VaNZ11_013179 [Volvox africanus]|uniref:Cytochrome P450 n=1 Tax=Volvox africanus TaxID=51714 RepID=A0ABQ5SFJ2_9CHLO|nr:hypothetical protein VaNZ11_013179 [Volvox africanus]
MYDTIRSRGTPVLPPDGVTDLWACLGRVRHHVTGAPLGRDALVPEIGALMMAGFDTSSHSVAWVLFALAAHPEVQRRCRRELAARGLLKERDGSPPRDPSLEDLSQLPYLNAVIDETMRMFPVAATASVREVTQPTRVGDYLIPPGVIVWPMLYALHNSTHNWVRPDEFRPERWLAEPEEGGGGSHDEAGGNGGCGDRSGATLRPTSQSLSDSADAGSCKGNGSGAAPAPTAGVSNGGKRFMPFSDGMKSCMGQALGLMEVRTMLVVLLGRYRVDLDPSGGGPEAVQRSMIMSLTLKIKGGLRLVFTPLRGSEDEDGASPGNA